MRAAVFKGKGLIEVEEVPMPKCGETDVIVKVMACGICGTDVHIFNGAEGAAATTPPVILGHEFSGIVEQVGAKVEGIKVGDRVSVDPNNTCGNCYFCKNGMAHFCENMIGYGTTTHGGFAQYCAVHYKQVYKLAPNVSFEEGAMCEPIACCLHGIDLCEIKPGNTVMIIGGGPIGLMMVQLAKISGAAKIILLEPVAEKRAIGTKLGAHIVIDPIHENVDKVLAENNINQIEVVIECVGLKSTMMDAIKYAGKSSVAMLFGLGGPNDEIPIKPYEIFRKEVTIRASYINPYTQGRAVNLINSGKIDVKSLMADTISLEELSDVLSDPSRRQMGKVMVNPWS